MRKMHLPSLSFCSESGWCKRNLPRSVDLSLSPPPIPVAIPSVNEDSSLDYSHNTFSIREEQGSGGWGRGRSGTSGPWGRNPLEPFRLGRQQGVLRIYLHQLVRTKARARSSPVLFQLRSPRSTEFLDVALQVPLER